MKITLKIFLIFLFLGLLTAQPTPSYAWHRHGFVGVSLDLWPGPYYYGYGYPYYPYYSSPEPYYYPGYATVSSPSFQPVLVNGVTYYVNNGTYYLYTQYGYQAVPAPGGMSAPVVQTTTQVTTSPASDTADAITVNVPNGKGGYTAVVLKRSGTGFVGPQGEFYPEFPKVAQLQVVYGK
jgi:hypothetical protein